MASGRKSVLSKDTIHLKQTHQSVFESIMIGVLFGGRGGGWIRPKQIYVANYKNWYETPLKLG